jgi:hypothetical protein
MVDNNNNINSDNKKNSRARRKFKIAGIIASLAILALFLSPVSSLLKPQNTSSTTDVNGGKTTADTLLQNNLEMQDNTVSNQISEQDFKACNSINDSVRNILGVVNENVSSSNNNSSNIDDRKIASDTLTGEFCNRPVLIHEIMSAGSPSLNLVAYACDAAFGKVGTPALKDSLSDHKEVYCSSAKQEIENRTNSFSDTIQQFRTEYLPLLIEANNATSSQQGNNNGNSSSSQFNATEAELTLDKVTQVLEQTRSLVNSGEYYSASKSLDNASETFREFFEKGTNG